ncbi:TetR/AcrR family transcriptional regulator [Sinomicrobium sp. M5D2P17]
MRPQKVLDIEVINGLAKVFRSVGYEGASLKELSEETGLKKASLYHRFPDGKQEMAASVLMYLDRWVRENVFHALRNTADKPSIRLKNGLLQIRKLYGEGEETCILNAFSMKTGLHLFRQNIYEGMKEWLDTFTELGIAFQLSPETAREYAMQTLIEIQGSLILTRTLDDTKVFGKTLQNIENRYLEI